MPKPTPTIPATEAARILGISATRMRQLITGGRIPAAGRIPGPGLGTGWQVRRADVLDYQRTRRNGRPPKVTK